MENGDTREVWPWRTLVHQTSIIPIWSLVYGKQLGDNEGSLLIILVSRLKMEE